MVAGMCSWPSDRVPGSTHHTTVCRLNTSQTDPPKSKTGQLIVSWPTNHATTMASISAKQHVHTWKRLKRAGHPAPTCMGKGSWYMRGALLPAAPANDSHESRASSRYLRRLHSVGPFSSIQLVRSVAFGWPFSSIQLVRSVTISRESQAQVMQQYVCGQLCQAHINGNGGCGPRIPSYKLVDMHDTAAWQVAWSGIGTVCLLVTRSSSCGQRTQRACACSHVNSSQRSMQPVCQVIPMISTKTVPKT